MSRSQHRKSLVSIFIYVSIYFMPLFFSFYSARAKEKMPLGLDNRLASESSSKILLDENSSDLFLAADEVLSQVDQDQTVLRLSGYADYDGLKLNLVKNSNQVQNEDLYYCPFPDPVLAKMICSYVKSQHSLNPFTKNQSSTRDQIKSGLKVAFGLFIKDVASPNALNAFQSDFFGDQIKVHFQWGPFDGAQKNNAIECHLRSDIITMRQDIRESLWKCIWK